MYELINYIKNGPNKNKKAIAIFVGLAKVSDAVPHRQLNEVLEHHASIVLEVFKSYLKKGK